MKNKSKTIFIILTILFTTIIFIQCYDQPFNEIPDFIKGDVIVSEYDGISDDLLTAGLGQSGLQGTAPDLIDPLNPTAGELRRLAIYTNYRALVDIAPGGGYGTFFGPALNNKSGDPEGKVAGKEYLAYSDDGSGKKNITLMVQIPDTFDPQKPCIITAPSSGARGVYGAIGTAGEWGLKKGCAVAYADKGTGMGVHDLESNSINLINGLRADATTADLLSNFTAITDDEERLSFLVEYPHRIAFKLAHSGQNDEANWGLYVLQSIEFAFYILNLPENYGNELSNGKVKNVITPHKTIVIASSISAGGASSIKAIEMDSKGLIDGAAVSEPDLYPEQNIDLKIKQGDKTWEYPNHSKNLIDYLSLVNVYLPCAVLSNELKTTAPYNFSDEILSQNRCTALQSKGLLIGTTFEEMAEESLAIINNYGILHEQNPVMPSHHTFYVNEAIAFSFASGYGRFKVTEHLCGFSYAVADLANQPVAAPQDILAVIFSTANGFPPTGGIQLFNDNSPGGALVNRYSFSPSSGLQDQNADGALCLRSLSTGKDSSGNPLTGQMLTNHLRFIQGISEVQANGILHGTPVLVVHGRNDALLPPNHTSRAYYGLNKIKEGKKSQLYYYEITNAQHLDVFNGFGDFRAINIPLQYYFNQILDIMYDHLTQGKKLPPSQLVRTIPRGKNPDNTYPDLTQANIPPIQLIPNNNDIIRFCNNTVIMPETDTSSTSIKNIQRKRLLKLSKPSITEIKRIGEILGITSPIQ